MTPSVTLAIPTRNRLPYLRQIIQNALAQDYENLEILISDNGSIDGTRPVVEAMAEKYSRIRYRRNPETVPLITHFNQCLDAASGEFFVLVPDDDRINPTFVSALAKGLAENRNATVAIPANAIIDAKNELVRMLPPPAKATWEGIDFATEWLWKIHELPVANLLSVMGRTKMMRTFRYQPLESGMNADNLLFLQLALAGEVTFCRDAVFYWRDHQTQQGRTTPLRLIDKSGRQFSAFIESDANLPALFHAQPPARRRMIREGVRQMNAEAHLAGLDFFQKPFSPQTLCRLPLSCRNPVVCRTVFRFYARWFRQKLSGKQPMRSVQAS